MWASEYAFDNNVDYKVYIVWNRVKNDNLTQQSCFQSGDTWKALELYNEYIPAAVTQNYNIYRKIALDIISTHRSKESFDTWIKLRDMFFNLVTPYFIYLTVDFPFLIPRMPTSLNECYFVRYYFFNTVYN